MQSKKSTLSGAFFGGDSGNRTPQRALRLLSAFCFVFYAEKLCFANFSIICGFNYRQKLKHPFGCFFGGDGGNRNRVLKSFIGAFYMLSLLFGDSPHETAANSLFATVGSDT